MNVQFFPREHFSPAKEYRLLPFRFTDHDPARRIVVNEAGEYALLDRQTFTEFIRGQLSSDSESYRTLKAKHFLTDSSSNLALDLLATKYRTKKDFLSGFTKLHIFVVSLRCEHSCHYCQVSRVTSDKSRYDMTEATADRAIALMFRSPAGALKVEFQGGEPLLNFDLVRHIVLSVEERNRVEARDIRFVITTNLAWLTDEHLTFLAAHNIAVSTSIDGPAEVHNKNRPRPGNNSHALTVKGIQRCREALGLDNVAALMTTTRHSLQYPTEIVDEYVRLSFASIFLRSLSPYGFAIKTQRATGYTSDEFFRFYEVVLRYILELNRRGVRIREDYARIILTKILTPFSSTYVDLQSPAGAGISVAVYNYDGDVYPTDEARMLAAMGDSTMRLGNVHRDSYEDIFAGLVLQKIVRSSVVESLPGCTDCPFLMYCGADPTFNYATQGDFLGHRPTSDFCHKNMATIRLLIRMLDDAGSGHPDILSSWVR